MQMPFEYSLFLGHTVYNNKLSLRTGLCCVGKDRSRSIFNNNRVFDVVGGSITDP
jgi:hypothetical protein